MIYLDNNATTRIDDEVFEAMLPYLKESYGNASSIQHKLGREANQAIEEARKKIASYLGVSPKEIYFTSGATEAINWVLRGIFARYQSIGKHIITAKTEHKAVLSTLEILAKQGAEITFLQVDSNGNISLDELESQIRKDTILISLMAANNETGVIHPITEIGNLAKKHNILFFSDTTQLIGKESIELNKSNIDICCFSAHKMHGPKGVGGIFIRRKSRPIQLEPLITGGKQENGMRGGTYNTASIVGIGKAFSIASSHETEQLLSLRNYFEEKIIQTIENCSVHAKAVPRLGNTSNIHFKHVKSSELMSALTNIAISSGSACVSGDRDPSHVLTAMGIASDDALCSVRFSFSKYTTKEELDTAIQSIEAAVKKIRNQSPIWQLYKANLI